MFELGDVPEKMYLALKNSLDLRRFSIESVYRGRAFRVTGRGNHTNVYIRLEFRYNRLCANFSSVEFDERFRRIGLLTTMVSNVASIPEVNAIIIGGVCTEEMRNWCIKNNYRIISEYGYDYYKEV